MVVGVHRLQSLSSRSGHDLCTRHSSIMVEYNQKQLDWLVLSFVHSVCVGNSRVCTSECVSFQIQLVCVLVSVAFSKSTTGSEWPPGSVARGIAEWERLFNMLIILLATLCVPVLPIVPDATLYTIAIPLRHSESRVVRSPRGRHFGPLTLPIASCWWWWRWWCNHRNTFVFSPSSLVLVFH